MNLSRGNEQPRLFSRTITPKVILTGNKLASGWFHWNVSPDDHLPPLSGTLSYQRPFTKRARDVCGWASLHTNVWAHQKTQPGWSGLSGHMFSHSLPQIAIPWVCQTFGPHAFTGLHSHSLLVPFPHEPSHLLISIYTTSMVTGFSMTWFRFNLTQSLN